MIWLFITVTGIPVMLSHGELVFVDKDNVVAMVKCLFLSDEGYNWAMFQVSAVPPRARKYRVNKISLKFT